MDERRADKLMFRQRKHGLIAPSPEKFPAKGVGEGSLKCKVYSAILIGAEIAYEEKYQFI